MNWKPQEAKEYPLSNDMTHWLKKHPEVREKIVQMMKVIELLKLNVNSKDDIQIAAT